MNFSMTFLMMYPKYNWQDYVQFVYVVADKLHDQYLINKQFLFRFIIYQTGLNDAKLLTSSS